MKSSVVFLLFLLLFIFTFTCLGRGNIGHLRIKAEVINIPESSFDNEKEPLEFSYIILTYRVLKVCEGDYEGNEIKVAHGVPSRRKLKVGDNIVLEIKPTKEFREVEEILQSQGSSRSEDFIADYIFVGFKKFDSCL